MNIRALVVIVIPALLTAGCLLDGTGRDSILANAEPLGTTAPDGAKPMGTFSQGFVYLIVMATGPDNFVRGQFDPGATNVGLLSGHERTPSGETQSRTWALKNFGGPQHAVGIYSDLTPSFEVVENPPGRGDGGAFEVSYLNLSWGLPQLIAFGTGVPGGDGEIDLYVGGADLLVLQPPIEASGRLIQAEEWGGALDVHAGNVWPDKGAKLQAKRATNFTTTNGTFLMYGPTGSARASTWTLANSTAETWSGGAWVSGVSADLPGSDKTNAAWGVTLVGPADEWTLSVEHSARTTGSDDVLFVADVALPTAHYVKF